jgi:hypothetical protein
MMDEIQSKPTEGMSDDERRKYWQDWMKMNLEVINLTPKPVDMHKLSREDITNAGIAHALVCLHLHAIADAWDQAMEHLIATAQMLEE